MSDIRVLLMTAPSRAVAEMIVDSLVAEKMIACGNITLPVASIYRWQGQVERADEVLVIMKTVEESVQRVLNRASELHPYDVPELLAITVDAGSAPYMNWVRESIDLSEESKA